MIKFKTGFKAGLNLGLLGIFIGCFQAHAAADPYVKCYGEIWHDGELELKSQLVRRATRNVKFYQSELETTVNGVQFEVYSDRGLIVGASIKNTVNGRTRFFRDTSSASEITALGKTMSKELKDIQTDEYGRRFVMTDESDLTLDPNGDSRTAGIRCLIEDQTRALTEGTFAAFFNSGDYNPNRCHYKITPQSAKGFLISGASESCKSVRWEASWCEENEDYAECLVFCDDANPNCELRDSSSTDGVRIRIYGPQSFKFLGIGRPYDQRFPQQNSYQWYEIVTPQDAGLKVGDSSGGRPTNGPKPSIPVEPSNT